MSETTAKEMRTRFEPGTGNVFADIGIPEPEEALAKAQLAELIETNLLELGLTQIHAGELLGIDQGSVSKLINGRLDGFSHGRLIRYLNALGNDVEIVVRPSGPDRSFGSLTIASG
jgi:predicted XRE-type DNA-binding protein